jgi:uncharacterized protein
MTFLNHIPALVRMAMIFMLVLYGIRKKLSLGNAFMLGAMVMSLLFGMPFMTVIKSVFFSIVDPKTLSFALVVSLILVLSSAMESTGQMKRLLERFRGLAASPRLNIVIFPALIGLLPMPGGAVFSAPMVKELGVDSKLSNDQLSFVNYWFRHIWEYWWPMYPGVLLATMMADISLPVFVAVMIPLTLTAMGLGNIPLKRPEQDKIREKRKYKIPFGAFSSGTDPHSHRDCSGPFSGDLVVPVSPPVRGSKGSGSDHQPDPFCFMVVA